VAQANKTVLTMAMIETRQAIENLEEILATPGLDAVYVGPSDLSVSMGYTAGFDPAFPEVLDAILKVPAAAKSHGVFPGIHVGSVAFGKRMYESGYRFTSYMSDFRFLQWLAARAVPAMRGGKPGDSVP
jgi:2,4-dihydroxyhept-2-ene-1,7-dioic acid aldolase